MAKKIIPKATKALKARVKPMKQKVDKNSLCVSYNEFWSKINSSEITTLDFRPGNSGLVRLDQFAGLYDQYAIRKATIYWTPSVGTMSAGRVLMGVDYVNRIPSNENEIATFQPRIAGAVWQKANMSVDVTRAMKSRWMYVDQDRTNNNSTKLESAFAVHVYTNYDELNKSTAGEVWVDYEIEFVGPTFPTLDTALLKLNADQSTGGMMIAYGDESGSTKTAYNIDLASFNVNQFFVEAAGDYTASQYLGGNRLYYRMQTKPFNGDSPVGPYSAVPEGCRTITSTDRSDFVGFRTNQQFAVSANTCGVIFPYTASQPVTLTRDLLFILTITTYCQDAMLGTIDDPNVDFFINTKKFSIVGYRRLTIASGSGASTQLCFTARSGTSFAPSDTSHVLNQPLEILFGVPNGSLVIAGDRGFCLSVDTAVYDIVLS